MKTRFNVFQRLLSVVLALALVIGLAPAISTTVRGATNDLRIFSDKAADPSTLDWENYFGEDVLNTRYAGMVWSDKSVYAEESAELPGITLADADNFLVSMSAIASNLAITGHTTAPTDTMLVLDLSGSMIPTYEVGTIRQQGGGPGGYRYTEVNGRDVSLVEAMVDATNAAIDSLMEQNPNNRVGVVLFSGNTSTNQAATTGTATVVLPLGRYTGVSNGTAKEFLQMNATWQEDVTIYERSGYGQNASWQSAGTVDYVATNSTVSVSVKEGLTSGNDAVSVKSKVVEGGTYTQNGLYQALNEFNKVTDTRVPEGKVQSGADRVPAIVLMTDGAPTIADSDYSNIATSNTGNGGSENEMITFLTQLTAAYVRGSISAKYTEEGSAEAQKVLFLTLGLGTRNSTGATNTLYPAGTTGDVAAAWETYLAQSSGSSREYELGNYERSITRDANVAAMNYVDKYYYADNADALIKSFEQIISEIKLKAESYATLVENVGANFSGYVTFEDELGELMEVSDMKGILIGNHLYTGEELAKGMTEGNLGTPTEPNEKGDELIATVKERIPGTDTTAAQQLVHNAYLDQQLYWESADSWSNYIGWYANSEGNYVGFWDKDSGYENAPADALYANRSYGYLGANKTSDMMHVVVMVRTNLKTLHQTVFFKIPAALLPTVTYNVTLNENSPDQVEDFSVTSADPMQVVFEVGLRSDINSFNLEQKIEEHLAYNATEPDESKHVHVHRNADGSVTLYTNAWGEDNDTNGDGKPDYNETLTAKVALAHFHPALENGRYYYTEDTLVLDASGDPVTGEKPTDTDSDVTNGTGYHHDHYIYSSTGRTTIDMAITAATLEKAQQNAAGQWYIPAGTIYQELSRFRNPKEDNRTHTLDYSDYAAVFGVGENQDVYNFLGNNGSITIDPVSGIALTKQVEGTIENVTGYSFEVVLSDDTITPVLTDADGNAFTSNEATMVANGNGKFTVTMKSGVTAYLTGIPSGTEATITEVIDGDYKVQGVTVDEVAAAVVNNGVTVTVPTYSNTTPSLMLDVVFTNVANGYGDLVIEKEVVHDLTEDPAALADKEFTFRVKLTGDKIIPGTSSFATGDGGSVTVGADGTFTVTLKNDESITISNIPEGTAYTVTEEGIPDGFKLDSINGTAVATNDTPTTGTIVAKQIQQADFVNRYPDEYTSVTVPISVDVTKILDQQSTYTGDEEFTFALQKLLPDQTYPNIVTVKAKAGETETLLADQTFDEVGVYQYRVVEIKPDPVTPGMTYSTQRSLFVVEVTDTDMDGHLEVAVRNEAHTTVSAAYTDSDNEQISAINVQTSFTNVFAHGSAAVNVNVHKNLTNNTGVDIVRTRFQFEMVASDAQGDPLPNAQPITVNTSALGDATFNTTLETAGTYYFRISEVIPAEAVLDSASGKYVLNGMHYDPAAYLVKITAEVSSDSELVITQQTMVKLGDASETNVETAAFTNEYKLTPASARLSVRKDLVGRAATDADIFQAVLVRTDATFTANYGQETHRIYTHLPVSVVLNFTAAGTYHYKLTEQIPTGDTKGITYDTAVYHITVTVRDNGDGTLVADTPVIHKLGQTATVTEAKFVNTYTVTGEEQIVLSGLKDLDGRRLVAGEFEFALYDQDGKELDRVENQGDGSFAFKALRFTPEDLGADNADKVYTYTIKEIKNGLGGVEYATTVYTVKVTVSHEDGQLTVAQELLKDDVPYTGQILFENTYKADDVTVTLHGSKILSGDWRVADKGFTFHLHEADSNFTITDTAPVIMAVSESDYTNATASFQFELSYTDGEEGFYYFVLHEDTTAGAGGIGYDAGEYHITVNVSDPGDGQLTALVNMYRPGTGNVANDPALHAPVAVFTNAYSVEPEAFTLTGTKTLTGRDMAAGEFEFLVLDSKGVVVSRGTNAAAADGVAAAITFDKITYTAPGTYTYTVVEENGGLGGVTNDPDADRTIRVDVTDNGDGTLTAALNTTVSEQITFTNTYSVDAAELELEGTKTLTGDWSNVLAANKVFTFHILDGTTVKSEGSADLSVDDTITFQKLTFSAAGVYNYTIVEVDPNADNGITYSDKEYALVVTVEDNGDGTLGVSYTVDGTANGAITFDNSYATKPATLDLTAKKLYKTDKNQDKTLTGGEFEFLLTDESAIPSGNQDQSKRNNSNGDVTFDRLTFNQEGVYELQIKEVKELLGFIRWSEVVYDITITVEDNGKGQLVITDRKVEKDDLQYSGELSFTNIYDPYDATVTFSGEKAVAGNTGSTVNAFTFALYETDSTYDITGVTPETVSNAPNGKFSFAGITYDAEGTHYYVIRELPGTDPEMVYDGAEFRFKVEITDVNGQLKPVITDESTVAAVVANRDTAATAQVDFTNAPFEEVAKKEVFAANTSTNINGQKVNVGDELRYEITYTNYTGKTVDVVIEDTLPAHTTLVSGSAGTAVISGNKLTWSFEDVAPDAVITVAFSVTVDAPEAIYTNQAIVRDSDNDYTTNQVHNHTVEEIVKKDAAQYSEPTISIDGKKVSVGDELTYTIRYANVTENAITVTITDRIPAHTAYVSNTATQNGVYSAADGTVVWTLDLDAWEEVEVSFRVKVSDVDAEISNTATAFDGVNTVDSNEVTNHSYEDPGSKDVYYPSQPSISIDGRKVNVGDVLEYKITYFNHTGKDAQVTITDRIPAHTTLVSGSAGTGTLSGNTLTWENIPVVKGGKAEVTFQVKVDDADVQILNGATIVENNDYSFDTNTVTNHTYDELGDKEVYNAKAPTVKIDGKAVSVGDELIYTITYVNYTGKDAAVTITDNIPKYTTYVEGSAQGATYADGKLTWNLTVAKDGEKTVSFKVKVAQLGGTVSNQAFVWEGGNWYGTDTVTNSIVEKTVDKPTATLGEVLTYTVRYVNTTGAAADVTITDKLDANLVYVDGSAKDATYTDGTLTWVVRNVPAGEAVEVTFQAKVKAAAGVSAVTNQASVVVNGYEVKTNPVTTNVLTPALTMNKTQSVGSGTAGNTKLTVVFGDTVTYYIQVSNTGTGKALGVKITDQIPAGLIYKDGSVSAGGTVANGVATWQIGELAAGATVTVSFQVTVPGVAVDTEWKNVATVVSDNSPDGPEEITSSNQVVITEEGTDQPKTGDPTNLPLIFGMMLLSGAAMTALLVTTKKKEQSA